MNWGWFFVNGRKQAEWEAKNGSAVVLAKQREFLGLIEQVTHSKAPDEVVSILGSEVVESKPMEWSQTDKSIVDWALEYIANMTTAKYAYSDLEKEILMGPSSPRARTGELQAGLRMMKRLVYQEIAARTKKEVVTEVKDQIVCAQIGRDEVGWENLKYSPVDDDGIFEEVLD